MTVALNPAKAITTFEFRGLFPVVVGHINETDHTIALAVPFGTGLEYVKATYSTTGVSVTVGGVPQISGFTDNDFTSPVTYTVTAADGTTQDYVVTVTVAPEAPKAITAFSFQGLAPPVTGVITEPAHTIALTVPFGTDVTGLVATYTTTGASVAVGATAQVSGTTPNDFTNPVTYTVTAIGGATRDYKATVTVSAPVIGQGYGGGKIAYVLQSGDPGYVAGQTHGLIAATADQGAGFVWSNIAATEVGAGARGTALGTGQANTIAIVNQTGCTGGAAWVCEHLEIDDFDDWYLPSNDELGKLYLNRDAIGGFVGGSIFDCYWSSTEYSASEAWCVSWPFGSQEHTLKDSIVVVGRVRAVRSF